jgi:hypothetical protein
LQQKAGHPSGKCPGFSPDELRVAFSIPSGSLFLVNHPVLPEIFSSSPDTRVFVARKLHEGASPWVILSDKHECWTARKNFWRYTGVPELADQI